MTQAQAPKQYVAPDGMTAKEEEAKLKADFADVNQGSEGEIPADLANAYRYIHRALDYWKDQEKLVNNQIRRHLGNAQTAVVDGIPVAQRRVYKVPEHVRPEHWVDSFWPATGTKASQA